MRSGGTAAPSWAASLRLLLAAVVALLVSLAPSVSQACAMGASGAAAVCACPCCDLPTDDSVGRVPCCVRQADLESPLPVVDRPETAPRALAAAPFSVLLPAPQRVESDVLRSPIVRSTGPPIWLRCHSLLC